MSTVLPKVKLRDQRRAQAKLKEKEFLAAVTAAFLGRAFGAHLPSAYKNRVTPERKPTQ